MPIYKYVVNFVSLLSPEFFFDTSLEPVLNLIQRNDYI